MGKVINMEIDGKSCLEFARQAYSKGDYILCVQNINDGLALSDLENEVRTELFRMLIKVYEDTENPAAKMDIIVKSAPEFKGDFGKVDFKEFMSIDEDDGDEDYRDIFTYNLIKDNLINRDYCTAFGRIMSADIAEKYLVKITDYICFAYEEDKSFNINDFFVPAITLLAKLSDKTKIVNVMLACGGACKELAIDGISVFVDDIEDMGRLLALGEIYYVNGEMDCAKEIYKKVYQYNGYNEDALFHLSAICYAKGEKPEANRYFARYKVLFQNTYLPIQLYSKYFKSEYAKTTPALYPFLDANFIDEVSRELIADIQNGSLTAGIIKRIMQIMSVCEKEDDCILLPILPTILKDAKLHVLILSLLGNPAINNSIKKILLRQLYNSGYQGKYTIYFESKLITAVMVNAEFKNKFFEEIYRELMLEIPFMNLYIPLKCNMLKNAVGKAENAISEPEEKDKSHIIYLVLQNYAKMTKILFDREIVMDYLKIDSESAREFFSKYNLAKWILK